MPRRMEGTSRGEPRDVLRALTLPVAVVVAATVAAAWYVTWTTSDASMALFASPLMDPTGLGFAFALLVVMMVAMMLPSALPMILAYDGITRLEAGRPVRPPDRVATTLFASAYFVVWGLFALTALLGLVAVGLLDPMGMTMGMPLLLVSAGVLIAAGAWQATRTKEVCLTHCQSPMGFALHHWRSGRLGAWRMGLRHASYCIGCCWLFMLVLFVAGAMSLAWMGAISIAIFIEKMGWRPVLVSRAIGAVLVVAGAAFAAQAVLWA